METQLIHLHTYVHYHIVQCVIIITTIDQRNDHSKEKNLMKEKQLPYIFDDIQKHQEPRSIHKNIHTICYHHEYMKT